MANIIEIFQKRIKAKEALESLERDKFQCIQSLADLEREFPKKLKSAEEYWEEKLESSKVDY